MAAYNTQCNILFKACCKLPITGVIIIDCQHDINLLNPVIVSVSAVEDDKILVEKQLTSRKTNEIMLINLKYSQDLTAALITR